MKDIVNKTKELIGKSKLKEAIEYLLSEKDNLEIDIETELLLIQQFYNDLEKKIIQGVVENHSESNSIISVRILKLCERIELEIDNNQFNEVDEDDFGCLISIGIIFCIAIIGFIVNEVSKGNYIVITIIIIVLILVFLVLYALVIRKYQLFRKANLYKSRENYQKAIETYELIIEEYVDYEKVLIKAYLNKGICEFRINKIKESEISINTVLSMYEDFGFRKTASEDLLRNISMAYFYKAIISIKRNALEEIEKNFIKSIEVFINTKSLLKLADFYIEKNRKNDAIELLNQYAVKFRDKHNDWKKIQMKREEINNSN